MQWKDHLKPRREENSCNVFEIPYPPSVNRYWKSFRGRVVLSKEGRQYKVAVAEKCAGIGIALVPAGKFVSVSLDVHRPRKIGDLDNTMKAIFDALQGIAYENDSQIVEIFARRFDDKSNPRVVVAVDIVD
jgi:Holliday junction resolvase RusA-like endonuclease